MGDLEERVRVLEDREAIQRLMVKFAYSMDRGDWQMAADLFTEEAVYDSGLAQYQGKAGIIKFVKHDLSSSFPFTVHMVHNAMIEVAGDRASGIWYSDIPASYAPASKAVWIATKYEAECTRTDKDWKFNRFRSIILYATPYDEGWNKRRLLEGL